MYVMQVFDGQSTGMHWQRQKVAAEHLREHLRAAPTVDAQAMPRRAVRAMAETAGDCALYPRSSRPGKDRRLEVAVVIGTDRALTSSAIVPAPPEVEEFVIAGFCGSRQSKVKCQTVDLEVPANAEIVWKAAGAGRTAYGRPFGDNWLLHHGGGIPGFSRTCITHRKEPVYAATIVGKPPMEDAWMGKAVERIFLP